MASPLSPLSSLRQRVWNARGSYLLLAPTFLLLLTFSYYPAIQGIACAFQEVEPGGASRFIGLRNFQRMIQDYLLLKSTLNLAILLAGNVLKGLILPLFMATLIYHLLSPRLRYTAQTFFLFPIVVPSMVGILLWKGFIYDANVGLLNNLLGATGLEGLQHSWLGEHSTALGSILFTGFPWVGGVGFLVFLAGLLNIPQSVAESTQVDGAGPFRRFFSIELPLVLGQIKLVVILAFIGTLQDFSGILVMTGGGPGAATHVPALHMYYMAFRFDQVGYGAAIGVALFALLLGLTILNLRLIRSRVED